MIRTPRRLMSLGGLALAAVMLFDAPATADPAVTVTTNYYWIEGSSAGELRREMDRKGPKGFWAYTNWYVNWSATCHVSLRVVYTLPRWRGHDQAPAELKTKWDTFLANLIAHEKGHGTIGRNAAKEIDNTRCSNNPGAIAQRWAKQDRVYDAKTGHGRTQGVEF